MHRWRAQSVLLARLLCFIGREASRPWVEASEPRTVRNAQAERTLAFWGVDRSVPSVFHCLLIMSTISALLHSGDPGPQINKGLKGQHIHYANIHNGEQALWLVTSMRQEGL